MRREFNNGDLVYCVHDERQAQHMIVAYSVAINGSVLYTLSSGGNTDTYFAQELSRDKSPKFL